MAVASPALLFPPLTRETIQLFQFSSWYPRFKHISIKSTVIRPLNKNFCDYLNSDGVYVPAGSEDRQAESGLSDDDDDSDSDSGPHYAFPDLDARIREIIAEYGAVFPKLNFSSPKDASWILPAGSPLKCTSPADVYMLLKASDFISHDLSEETVFDGCGPSADPTPYELELVLRKWYLVDTSRELRCFVRQDRLLGMCQRDTNYYQFLNDPDTANRIVKSVEHFWETNIKGKWGENSDYVFDILLTRDLTRAHLLDFNPYAPRTDPLLFTYDDLLSLLNGSEASHLRVIDSPLHPAATRNAPAYQHNMVPFETLNTSSGLDVETFADRWTEEIANSMKEES